MHDFPSNALGKAIPYGVDDIADNSGFVSVGTDHDTPVFAVTSIDACLDSRPGRTNFGLALSAICRATAR